MLKAAQLASVLVLAAAAGTAAAAGAGWWLALLVAAGGLVALGAALPVGVVRAVILGALLLVPDVASGRSLGLLVHWSQGLTLSNFVVPALALPLLAGAWLAGRRILPVRPGRWPRLARWCYWLLAWCGLTLLVPWAAGGLSGAAQATLLGHVFKLALFVGLGVVLAAGVDGSDGRDGSDGTLLRKVLFWSIVVNAVCGLGQAAGWLPVFSPLAHAAAGSGAGARATGLFYDANLYGVLAAWALLWVVCDGDELGRWGQIVLAVAVAGNLVAAGSRAGYLAFAAGCGVLLLNRCWRPVAMAAVVLLALGALFPVRSWQRIGAAVETADAVMAGPASNSAAVPHDAGTVERLGSMAQSLQQIAAHPLLGLGFGQALYLGVPDLGGGPVRRADERFNGAQNMPLTVLAETGPVGLVLFLITIAAPLRRPRSPGELAMLAGFVGLLAACMTIEALWNTRLLALTVLLTAGVLFPGGEAILDIEAAA